MADEFTKAALYGIKTFNKKVKEKIGIEKLIELLNEYEKEVKKSEFYEWEKGVGGDTNLFRRDTRDEEGSHIYSDTADTYVISKKYGFIGWLVENDKIDLGEKLFNLTKNDNRKSMICDLDNNDFSWEDTFLMLLSISDTPIEDLLLYLK